MTHSEPLPYLQRIRDWYLALGYAEPYRWAQHDRVAFTTPSKPLSASTLGLITTAAPFVEGAGDQGPGASYNGKAKFFDVYAASTASPPQLGIAHVAIDRAHTTAEDPRSFFPLAAFEQLVTERTLGRVSEHFYGLPTDRSTRRTRSDFAPRIAELCAEDGVDVAVLVPNCPVCHQSAALVANHLEASGIATVVMGCARDIVEHVGVPRLLFNDLPLGNAAGPPGDEAAQRHIAMLALELLHDATCPRTTRQSPVIWPDRTDWKRDYSNPALLSDTELSARRAEFERVKRERDQGKHPAS